jgi:hypothetical protein
MGKAQEVGMEKSELRMHVKLARRAPVHIAFALGGDGKAIVMMDKRKQPRAILKDLKEQAADARNHRFGAIMLDPDDPKVARITVDKAASGMARKLVLAFKGTGVKQIQLMTEDGQAFDSAVNEEDEDEEQQDSRPGAETNPDQAAAGSDDENGHTGRIGPEDQQTQPQHDADQLKNDLIGLVKRMMGVIAKDPTQKAALTELATDAQASLKRGDLEHASAGIDVFREALDGAASTQSPDAGTSADASSTDSPAAAQAVQRYRKSRAVWIATRAKIDADIKKLSDTVLGMDHGGVFGDDLEQNFLGTVDPILSTLDTSLADLLSTAEKAGSQDEASQALDEARATIGLYQNFVHSNDTIKELDKNPFMPLAIAKTLNASLQVLSAAMK